jgi:hypothetical protein
VHLVGFIIRNTMLTVTMTTALYNLRDSAYIIQPPKKHSLVPWFLGLFLGLFRALIQNIALDRPHQLQFLRYG